MAEIFRLVRIFLASPGDLLEERRLVKDVELELNGGIAEHLNYRVELKGWEDTLSGSGRPQAIINKELDNCELFIGLMSRRWGTPPSSDSTYSSGFEEEFERSSNRLKISGQPEMAMYFKKIDPKFLEDQGDDLKKVLAFKKRVVSKREILYEEFDDPHDLQKRVRLKIQKYLFDLIDAEVESQDEEKAKTRESSIEPRNVQSKDSETSPFSAEGYSFLKVFLDQMEDENSAKNMSALDVARFRLLSSTISQSGNDEPFLGAHDANIIYSNKQVKYGSKEVRRLIDCALQNIDHENVPLWHWYNIYSKQFPNFLVLRSIYASNEDISFGALKIMKLIGSTLPIQEEHINRKFIIDGWLSNDRADSVKLAALQYLKHYGVNDDLPLIQPELDRADPKTLKIALETIVSIKFRYSKAEALKTVFTNQFESFDQIILEEILSVPLELDEQTLRSGLKHSNKRIRLESFKRLSEEKLLTDGDLQDLKKDPFAQIRKEVLGHLSSIGRSVDDREAKSVIVKPQERGGLGGIFSQGYSDIDGEACYDEYLLSKYSNMPNKELLDIVKKASIFDNTPYFALYRRYFRLHSEELRNNVDNRFKDIFEAHIEYLEQLRMPDETINKAKGLENYLKGMLTRKALNILCEKVDIKDLDRIRKNMRSGHMKSSEDEIEYFRKLGEWEDIPYILKAEKDNISSTSVLTHSINYNWHHAIAKTVYNIGKDRLDELFNIEMPAHILAELIRTCSSSYFSKISHQTLLGLLNKKEDTTRKFASLKSAQSFSKTKLASLLKEYVDGQEYRYYNVIFWLDFGVAMPKSITRKAINIAFEG